MESINNLNLLVLELILSPLAQGDNKADEPSSTQLLFKKKRATLSEKHKIILAEIGYGRISDCTAFDNTWQITSGVQNDFARQTVAGAAYSGLSPPYSFFTAV